jgi:DNA-binding NtrC family response regulator
LRPSLRDGARLAKDYREMLAVSSPLRVLVVDDEPLLSWSLAATLEDAGDIVVEAHDAEEAVRAVSAGPAPDVVLLDYQLPDSTDLRLLARITQLAPRAAVILMSAHVSSETARSALSSGACQVVAKPIDMDDVPAIVRTAAKSTAILGVYAGTDDSYR